MNKTYLITGATSDVGKQLILSLNQKDCHFLLQGFGSIDTLKDFCKNHNINASFFCTNLSCPEDTDNFIQQISEYSPTHFIHLPALNVVNTKFKNFDEQRFMLDLNVQVLSAIKICKAITPKMAKARYGKILFMATSYILSNPPKNTAAYLMAKNAILALMKSLATDYASFGINVNCISPSMIETKFLDHTSHIIIESAAASHPMKRNATVNDVVPAMKFLLSDDASFITGVNLPITGGSVIE